MPLEQAFAGTSSALGAAHPMRDEASIPAWKPRKCLR